MSMLSDPTVAITAAANVAGIGLLLLLARRSRRLGIWMALVLPVGASVALALRSQPESTLMFFRAFAVLFGSVSVVWFPPAVIAIVAAGRSRLSRWLLSSSAVAGAAVFGAFFIIAVLAFECYLFENCL